VPEPRAISVTEAMNAARQALEGVRLRVVGEVSEFNDKPGYKAAYFSVCDAGATMPCLMWRDQYVASGVALRCGMLVEMSGYFSAYVPKGRMQFTVRSLSLAGEGNLRLQVAQLARKLEAEGLMRPERKRSLPRFPERIGVVTSPRGKAIHDVLRTLRRRYPLAEVLVAGVPVEGESAPAAIVNGIETAGASGADVLLLVRGGGSYEDLMPFSSEEVARAVARCPIPVVTGIGHEPDNSIADMVADVRASTPTAAAEAVAPSLADVRQAVSRERRGLAQALQARVRAARLRVERLADRPVLRDPHAILGIAEQALDLRRRELVRGLPARLAREEERIAHARERLTRGLSRATRRSADVVAGERGRLAAVGRRMLSGREASLGRSAARLEAYSPVAVLARGYSVTYSERAGAILTDAAQTSPGDVLRIRLHRGQVFSTVTSVEPQSEDSVEEE
jgi:exodeoxyribonuclease VII large subunit